MRACIMGVGGLDGENGKGWEDSERKHHRIEKRKLWASVYMFLLFISLPRKRKEKKRKGIAYLAYRLIFPFSLLMTNYVLSSSSSSFYPLLLLSNARGATRQGHAAYQVQGLK